MFPAKSINACEFIVRVRQNLSFCNKDKKETTRIKSYFMILRMKILRSDKAEWEFRSASACTFIKSLHRWPGALGIVFLLIGFAFLSPSAAAQGGPPYYTNDPGTPGNKQWEINLGYEPFLYDHQSFTHSPDVDINFGLGNRIQLTFENAWLRVHNPPQKAKYGLGQDQLGVKWRFYDDQKSGFAMSVFPQVSVNNPGNSFNRGITPRGASVIIPLEFTKKLGPVDLNWELGYNAVHYGSDTFLAGVVAGHEFTEKFEMDAEFYALGTFHGTANSDTLELGARYKIHPPFILLLMAGRSVTAARNNQPGFVGYLGMQFLLPPRPFAKD